jgi:hypothetical protein
LEDNEGCFSEDDLDEGVSECLAPIRIVPIKESDLKRHVRFVAPSQERSNPDYWDLKDLDQIRD